MQTNIEWHCSGCDEKDKRIKRLEDALDSIRSLCCSGDGFLGRWLQVRRLANKALEDLEEKP